MTAAVYWWRASRRAAWRQTLVVVLVCAILGAVSLAALAGARRTESAYGRYLASTNASTVSVNIPQGGTALIAKVRQLPGIRSSAAWLGLDANPVVHGHADDSFLTNALAGSLDGEYITQDRATVLKGRLPHPDATHEIALTAGLARFFGVGVGGKVTYQFEDAEVEQPVIEGYATYRVVGIVDQPPVLVDQFDQTQGALLPQSATEAAVARFKGTVAFSWVGLRLTNGDAGIPALQSQLAQLATQLGHGLHFALRRLDTIHGQVQQAIEPQAVALGVFGGLVALAMLALVGQGLAELLHRSAPQLEVLEALGMTRFERTMAGGIAGGVAVLAGMVLAVGGAVALSPLAPVGPVRQFDPARGVSFDSTVLVGGGIVLTVVLLALAALVGLAGAPPGASRPRRPHLHGGPYRPGRRIAHPGRLRNPVRPGADAGPAPRWRVGQPGRFDRGRHGGDHRRDLRRQPQRGGVPSGSLRLELERADPVPRRLRRLVRLQYGQAHGGATGNQRLVDLRLHPTPD